MLIAILWIAIGIYTVIHLQYSWKLVQSYRHAHEVSFSDQTRSDALMPDHVQAVAEVLLDHGFSYLGATGVETPQQPEMRVHWLYVDADGAVWARLMDGGPDQVSVLLTSTSASGALTLTAAGITWSPFDDAPQPGARKLERALESQRRRAHQHDDLLRVTSLGDYLGLVLDRTPAQSRLIMRARVINLLASRTVFLLLLLLLGLGPLLAELDGQALIGPFIFLTLVLSIVLVSLRTRTRFLAEQDLQLPPPYPGEAQC